VEEKKTNIKYHLISTEEILKRIYSEPSRKQKSRTLDKRGEFASTILKTSRMM
jgi:hypothetical protein